jgi:3-hydroxyacyl-[acyl-carrier-protein] dehydratase
MKPDPVTARVLDREPVHRFPHAYPFRLLDRAFILEPGRWAVGVKNLTRDDPLLDAEGTLAPVLLAEAMAQTAGLAASDASRSDSPAVVAQIDRFRCYPPILAGDHLVVAARVVRRFGATVKVRASVRLAGRFRAAAELVLRFSHASPREP